MNGCPNCTTLAAELAAARAERDGWRHGFNSCVTFESRLWELPASDRPTAGGLFSDVASIYDRALSGVRDATDGEWRPITLTIEAPA